MNRLLAILALCFSSTVYAQTPAPTPPVVALPMPAPTVTATAGSNVTISWAAVTQSTTGALLTGPVTYNVWEVSSATPVLKASGLTTLSNERTNLAVGTPCYVITASVAGDIDSAGSTPPVCVNVVAAPVQVSSPANVTIAVSPPTASVTQAEKELAALRAAAQNAAAITDQQLQGCVETTYPTGPC